MNQATSRRIGWIALATAGGLAMATPAFALSDSFSLADNGQSIYANGSGGGGTVGFGLNFGTGPGISLGPGVTCVAGICGGFGASLNASGSVGLTLSGGTTGGRANIVLPIQSKLTFSNDYLNGAPFTVSTSGGLQAGGGPILAVSNLGLQASIAANGSISGSIGGQACVFACVGGSANLVNASGSATILAIDTSQAKPVSILGVPIALPGYSVPVALTIAGNPAGSYVVSAPLPVSGGTVVSADQVQLSATQSILSANIDAGLALALPGHGLSASFAGIGVSFNGLDIAPSVSIGETQKFSLSTPLDEKLTFSAPVNAVVGGQNFTNVTSLLLGVSDPALAATASVSWAGTPGHLLSRTYQVANATLGNQTIASINTSLVINGLKGDISIAGSTVNFCVVCTTISRNFSQVLSSDVVPLTFGGQTFAFGAPAQPVVTPGGVKLAARVGDAAPIGFISVGNGAGPGSDGLIYQATSVAGPWTASGAGKAHPGVTDPSAIQVRLNTTAAGRFVTQESVGLTTDGVASGTKSALPDASVTLAGTVYAPAVASVTRSVDFGIVHVGDRTRDQAVTVSNTAKAGPQTDQLDAQWSSVGAAPFALLGKIGRLDAGQSDNHLAVGLNTSRAGVFRTPAGLTLSSHDSELTDLALPAGQVRLSAQVNNFAQAGYVDIGGAGTLTGGGAAYVLDFGHILTTNVLQADLRLLNTAIGPADDLGGSFVNAASFTGLGLRGFNRFAGLNGGFGLNLAVDLNHVAAGLFDDLITLNDYGSNGSGYSGGLAGITLEIKGDSSFAVPEPGSAGLLMMAMTGLTAALRRRR